MHVDVESLFDLTGRVAVITGGSGLLGYKHAEAIAAAGGTPVLVDLARDRACGQSRATRDDLWRQAALGCAGDITDAEHVQALLATVLGNSARSTS